MPDVTVIIAAYQAERWLAETLDSVARQSFADWECIVVDDGSQDATAEIVRSAARRDCRYRLIQQTNAGPSAARNRGLSAVDPSTEHVAILDSEDLWLPDTLERLRAALAPRPEAVGVCGWAEYIDAAGRPVRSGEHRAKQRVRSKLAGRRLVRAAPDDDITFDDLAVAGTIWPPATALFRYQEVLAVGGYNEALPVQEDWDLYLRLARRGPIVFIDRHVAWYRLHDGNLTGRYEENVFFQNVVRHLAWRFPANTPAQRKVVARAWRRVQLGAVHAQCYAAYRMIKDRRVKSFAAGVLGALYLSGELFLPGPPKPRRLTIRWKKQLQGVVHEAAGL